jgi:hypothetical protein
MSTTTAEQGAWISRVLGFTLPQRPATPQTSPVQHAGPPPEMPPRAPRPPPKPARDLKAKFDDELKKIEDRAHKITSDISQGEVGKIFKELVEPATALAASGPHDYDGASALLEKAGQRLYVLELPKRRYEAGLAVAEGIYDDLKARSATDAGVWAGWGAAPIPGVTTVVANAKTDHLDPAQAKAAAFDYLAATMELDRAVRVLSEARGRLNQFEDFANTCNLGEATYNSTAAAAGVPSLKTALDTIKADTIDKAAALARAGDFEKATTAAVGAGTRMAPLVEVIDARNAAMAKANALKLPLLAADKARVQKDRLDAADALIAAGNFSGATALLHKTGGELAQVAGYGAALEAAQAELDKLNKPEVAAEAARIKADFLDAAKSRAGTWDYAGATVLLQKVPSEAAATGHLLAARDQAETANSAAQKKAASDPGAAFTLLSKMLTELESNPNAASIAPQLNGIRTGLANADTAIKDRKPDDARAALDKAGKQIVEARMLAERDGQDAAAIQAAKVRVAGLPAEAAPEKAAVESTWLQPAVTSLTGGNRDAGLKQLANIEPACVAAEAVAAKAREYATALPAAEAAVNGLADAFIAADKAQIRTTRIDTAKARAAARDFGGALELLGGVANACTTAQSIADTNNQYAPVMTDLEHDYAITIQNIQYAQAHSITVKGVIATQTAALKTEYIDPAKAKVAARGFGEAALAAMREALALATDGHAKSNPLAYEMYSIVDASDAAIKAASAIGALKTHPSQAAVANDIATLEKRHADAIVLLMEGQIASAHATFNGIVADAADVKSLADAASSYGSELAKAQTRFAACEARVATIAPAPAAIATALAAIRSDVLDAARRAATVHQFTDATAALKPAEDRCKAVESMVDQRHSYDTALASAETALAALTQPVVADDAKRIAAQRIDPAKKAAETGDYKSALDLLAKANVDAADAARVAAGTQEAETARAQMQPALDGDDRQAAIAAVEKQLDALRAHPGADAIKDVIDGVAHVIAAAPRQPIAAAKANLTKAADICAKARTAADRAVAYERALAAAETQLAALASPVVATDKAAIQKDQVEVAKKAVAPPGRDFAKAIDMLEAAQRACVSAQEIAAKDTAFQTAVAAAQAALDGLHALAPIRDPLIGDDAEALQRTAIDAAKALIAPPGRDYDGAQKLLARVAPACKTLALKRQMAADTAPTKADIDAILAQPGGTAELDKMVASLPDTTAPTVIQRAIEARFGVDSFQNLTKTGALTGPGLTGAKSLKKIYALMAKVPQRNVQNNASLKQIQLFGGAATEQENKARGSYYSGTDKRIVLSCGRDEDIDPQPLSEVTLALPNVDPDAEMVPDDKVPTPKYFDWTTLHEVGHAIDDKTHLMATRGADPAFGGWQTHGADVAPVSKAVAKACRVEGAESYLAAYLLQAKAARPSAPAGVAPADWDKAVQAAEEWCDAIRVGKELWESGSGSSDRAVDGRVYHEAYGGTWVSYDLAARTKGITGYQFRAPGEWMAELYAAFHTNKLNPNHPATTWLRTL